MIHQMQGVRRVHVCMKQLFCLNCFSLLVIFSPYYSMAVIDISEREKRLYEISVMVAHEY